MRILITGSSGFLGSALMTEYLTRNIPVMGIDILEPRYHEHLRSWQKINILDRHSLSESILNFKPTHIIHLAARTDLGLRDDITKFSVNTAGVKNIIEVCAKTEQLKLAIFTSSILVCKPDYKPKHIYDYSPSTTYGKSKAKGEQILRLTGRNLDFTWCIIRPSSIWGPGYGSHYLDFFQLIAKGRYLHPGKADNIAVYGYIKNFVHQINSLINSSMEKVNRKVFYLGDYKALRLRHWAEMIGKEAGRNKIMIMPDWFSKTAALCGDILCQTGFRKVPLTSFRLKNMSTNRLYDTSAIQQIAGKLPYTVIEGVRETLEWLKTTERL